MASIHKDILINAPADAVWAAVRDIGAPHRRLTPGLLLDTQLEADARVVRFANGMTVRERIVSLDDERRRFAYAAEGGLARHHNAAMQVFDEGPGRCRLAWTTDVLPDSVVATIGGLIEQGSALMKRTLERQEDTVP